MIIGQGGYRQDYENHCLIAPRGFEPLKGNQQPVDNKTLTKNQNPVLSTGLDKILQKYPELEQIITAWPNLPEHIKVAIKALIESVQV